IGAHPGFDDLNGFGRRRIDNPDQVQLGASVVYQIGALSAIARCCGTAVSHVKLHGAMANMASEDSQLAHCLVSAIRDYDPSLAVVAMASTALQSQTEALSQPLLREVYADRAYNDDGTLMSRNMPGSVIHDPELAADRVLAMIETQSITSVNGASISVVPETVCVHGDTPGAVAMAEKLRRSLEANAVVIAPYRVNRS
ncbi:MAG: 5-oxoprolinase subunit PxpA, partial [Pseudomonadota bacterium]